MKLTTVLKLTAPAIVVVGCMHLLFGPGAEVMLGANIAPPSLIDPVLDSQNRFYGVAFTVYGFLFYLCATDLRRYQTVLKILLAVFFAAGCARLASIVMTGLPPVTVQLLLAVELLLPPLGAWWLSVTMRSDNQSN